MSKRVSEEEVIVHFFNHAEVAKAETVFNIVKGIMRHRVAGPVNGSGARTKGATSSASKNPKAKAANTPPASTPTPSTPSDLPM